MEPSQIVIFLVASLAVILTPGQDLLLVMSRAVSQGARAGVLTATGVSMGLLVHSLVASFGLGALLLSSASLFTAIKFIGACYLFYLGFRLLRTSRRTVILQRKKEASVGRLLCTGAFSNISNPHVTIFFLAFLPQFISTDARHPALLLFELGICFALLTFLVKGPVGYFAGILSHWLVSRPQMLVVLNRFSGAMLIALGVRLLLSYRR